MQHQGNFREVVQRTSPHLEEPKRKKGQEKVSRAYLDNRVSRHAGGIGEGWIKHRFPDKPGSALWPAEDPAFCML